MTEQLRPHKTGMILCALALAGCVPAPKTSEPALSSPPASPALSPPATPDPGRTSPGVAQYGWSTSLWKVCDQGRAIYALESGYKQGSGIAIVENAPECAQ